MELDREQRIQKAIEAAIEKHGTDHAMKMPEPINTATKEQHKILPGSNAKIRQPFKPGRGKFS
jgi:hypothetical protein